MQLEGKVALITEAGSGIGRALACEAALRGMRPVLAGRGAAALERTASMLPADSIFSIFPADVSDAYARRLLCAHVAQEWGQLNVLVNNGGLPLASPLAATTDRDIERLMTANLIAPIALTRALLPLLVATAPSRVVNVGSHFGHVPYPFFAAYSAAKCGLAGFSIALRRELGSLGVGVTYAAPRATPAEASGALEALREPLGMALDMPETIARRVWEAVAREADDVHPNARERLARALQGLWPRLGDRALARRLPDGRLRSLLLKAMPWVRPTLARHHESAPVSGLQLHRA